MRTDPDRGRSPDYRLTMTGHNVIAEVKQVDPNDEELRLMKQLEELVEREKGRVRRSG